MPQPCPCNPTAAYASCCQPLHEGRAPAATAEALMRSRYSAYVLGLRDYLLTSWHPQSRPTVLDLDDTPGLRWLGLDVKRHVDGGDDTAVVEFVARYKVAGAPAVRLHEVSRFRRIDGQWLYLDGEFPLLETTESRLEVLRQALVTGERSGRARYSYESLVSELDSEQQ